MATRKCGNIYFPKYFMAVRPFLTSIFFQELFGLEGVEYRSYDYDSITVSSAWELTSVSMCYSQGGGVHTPLSRLVLYPRYCSYCGCCGVCGLPSARSCAVWDDNNKVNVCTPSTPAGLKCPPPSTTISSSPGLRPN